MGFYDVVNDVLYLNSNTKDDTPFVSGPYIQAGEEIEVTNTTLVTNPFNHSVYAKWEYAYHNVLYQLDRGEFVASSIEDESWIKTSDKVVTKEYPNDVEYGDLPVAISDGYDFVGWAEDKNADADAKALPTGYSQLEYIEANYENGLNQYIDTGYKPSQDSFGYIIDYIFFNDLNSGTASVMSCYGSWNSSSYCFGLGGNYNREYGAHNMGWIAGEGHSTGVCNTPGERSTISVITKDQKTTTISPLYNKVDETLGSKVSAINIPLFACNSGNMKEFAHTKIYSLKLLEGDEVVRDFVPAMWSGGVTKYSYRGIEYEQELSQGTIGLYDAKNDCFYINSGSDSKPFKGGEEVYPLIKSSDIVSLTKDVTYISIWKNKVFTITLDPNDEVGSTKVIDFTDKTLSVSYLEKYGNKLPKLERKGYTFLGFFDGDNKIEENAIYEYTTNKTLKAKWQANTYKAKLISNCDIELEDDEIEVTFDGKYPELPALSKENFKLDGYRLSLVPSNFREVEYLEGTGSQYIDTGYHPNQATFGYEVDFMFINDLGGTRTCMGIWDAWTSANNTPCFSLGGNYKNHCGGYNYSWIAGDENCSGNHCNYGERVYESVFNDGETITSTSPLLGVTTSKVISNKTAAHKLYIFGNNGGNDGAAGENAHVKFYSIKLYELDKLVYNFVPAIYDGGEITYSYKGNIATGELSKSNVAGFYETVNGVFYINSGTGDFLCGEEVIDEEPIIIKSGDNVSVACNHSLIANWKPIEYKVRYVYDSSSMYYEDSAIEYIECNGDAYAYTNIKCDYKNQIEFELMLTSETDGGVLIGACGQTNAILLGINGDKKLYTIYGDKTQINTSDTPLELNKKYNVKYVSDAGNQYVYINDDVVLQTKIAGTFTPDYNYSLFAYNNMNKTATGNYQDMFKGVVYFCSIKTQGELKAELYPRINPDSNKVGLYDKVTGNFYASSTENEFIAGKKIEGESTDVVKYNEDYTIRKIEDKPKYTPQGWSLKEDLSTIDYEQEQVVKNLSNVDGDVITLYPIYKQTEGYIDIDYVESTPTKSGYCLTNVTQNGNSTITAEIMLLDDNSGGTIVGSTGEKNALSLDIVDKRIVVKYASGTYTSDMELETNKKYKIELITSSKDATVIVNVYDGETKYDNVINKESIATFTTTSYNLSLLTFNNKNSYSNTFIGRVYSISISTDGNTKGIYKPVIDVKTSKTYLYDKYNDIPMDIVGEFFSE